MSLTAGLDLCLFPAGTPPDGQLPNFENPPTYAPTVIAVSAVVLFFAALFTGCRLLANWKKLTWGDCMPLARLNDYPVLAHMSNKLQTLMRWPSYSLLGRLVSSLLVRLDPMSCIST